MVAESFFSGGESGTYRLESECEPLGELCTSSSESIGISAAVFAVGQVHWAALGYSIWNDLLSSAKRDQIIFVAGGMRLRCLSRNSLALSAVGSEKSAAIQRSVPVLRDRSAFSAVVYFA